MNGAGKTPETSISIHFSKLGEKIETEIFVFSTLDRLDPEEFPNDIFICGARRFMSRRCPRCADLYLTLVNREVEGGDAFFPSFEDKFELAEELRDDPAFKILHLPAQVAGEIKNKESRKARNSSLISLFKFFDFYVKNMKIFGSKKPADWKQSAGLNNSILLQTISPFSPFRRRHRRRVATPRGLHRA